MLKILNKSDCKPNTIWVDKAENFIKDRSKHG